MRTNSINSKLTPTLYDWSLLNREHKDIVQGVQEKWQSLIGSEESEPHIQQFLSEHAGMFFGGDGTNFAIGQLQLGSERRPDFVVIRDARCAGLHYEFIELKRPSHAPYSTGGTPSKHLTKASEQIRCWKRWLEDHVNEVRELLPSKHAVYRSCSFTIIIGRRGNSKEWLEERNFFGIENRVHIHSYDYLTDELTAKQFRHSCPPTRVHGDELSLNQLANPFVRAFTHKSWRGLLRRLGQSPDGLGSYEINFLTCAGEALAKSLKHNRLLTEFVRRRKSQVETVCPA